MTVTDSQFLVTGIIAGLFLKPDQPINCTVEMQKDADGVYLPEVWLTLASGGRLRITVEVER